ncbi:MAG: hypothetical protein AB7E79_06045 [Rhodospirillaceae bacterium]
MILTLYLARVLGLALIALGLIIMVRRAYYMQVYPLIVTERMTRMVFGTFALVGGLLLALHDPLWQTLPSAVIALVGWLVAAEALAYLALPDEALAKLIAMFNTPVAYIVGGVIALVLGLYLTIIGFGLLV